MDLTYKAAVFALDRRSTATVTLDELVLHPHELLVLLGGNGSGKSSVARALDGELELKSGTAPAGVHSGLISFERQMALIKRDYEMRNSDVLSFEEEQGILVRDLFSCDEAPFRELIKSLHMEPLLQSPVRLLSGGEGRKALLLSELAHKPDLLVLDCPFDGLDVKSRAALKELIAKIVSDFPVAVVLIVNRLADLPERFDSLGLISELRVARITPFAHISEDAGLKALLDRKSLPDIALPEAPRRLELPDLTCDPLIALKNINITYQRPIFTNFNFTVHPGERWLIMGPNGAGKSTLLSLITGDNPLVYANDVTVFGYHRGSGESIWEVRRGYGLVSGALHLDYRVSSPVLSVILSGLYDSIGLYNQPSDEEQKCAVRWLQILGLESRARESFLRLSFGEQRMVLIARALIKRPPLLILDEPYQGLDAAARALVGAFVSYVMHNSPTTVLFVSHYAEDVPPGMTHILEFVPEGTGYRLESRPFPSDPETARQ